MKKSFLKKKKKRMSAEFALQITSMADIFMILLVFLLKSYSASITNIAPTTHLSLPEIESAASVPKESLRIEIARDALIVDDKPVLKLNNFEFGPSDVAGESSPAITEVLNSERKKTPDPNTDSAVVLMADEGTPYSTIKRVVASAAVAGFVDLQLLVVQAQ